MEKQVCLLEDAVIGGLERILTSLSEVLIALRNAQARRHAQLILEPAGAARARISAAHPLAVRQGPTAAKSATARARRRKHSATPAAALVALAR